MDKRYLNVPMRFTDGNSFDFYQLDKDKLPEGYYFLDNTGKNHIVREENIEDFGAVIEKGTGLCGREARNITNDSIYVGSTCTDCLKELNKIMENCFYDSVEERWYDPREEC